MMQMDPIPPSLFRVILSYTKGNWIKWLRTYLEETFFTNPRDDPPSLSSVQAESKSSFYSDVVRCNADEFKGLNLSTVRSSRASVDLS